MPPASSSSPQPPLPAPRRARRPVRGAIAAGAAVFLVCLSVAGGHLYSPDEEILFRLTESIATRAAFDIEPVLGFATRTGRGGLQYPQYPPLQSIFAVPLYGFARLTRPLVSDGAIREATWETVQYHDQTPDAYWNRFWVVMFFNPVVTALTAVLIWLMAFRLADGDRTAAWLTSLAYGIATLALPHSRTFFTEPLAGLWLVAALAALLAWADERTAQTAVPKHAPIPADAESLPTDQSDPTDGTDLKAANDTNDRTDPTDRSDSTEGVDPAGAPGSSSIRWPLLAGLAAAAGVWTRVDFPLFLPGLSFGVVLLALPVGWHWKTPLSGASIRGLSWRSLVAFGVPLAIGLVGWFLFNRWRFGGAGATGYEDQPEGVQFTTPLLVGLHGFVCAPGKGLFFFSPPLLLALFGLRGLMDRRPAWTVAWLISGGLFFLAMCKWQNWAGGWCWGPRHVFQIHALLILGLAPLFVAPRKRWIKVAAAVALVLGLGVQVFGSSQSFIDFYQEYFAFTAREQPNFHALYSLQEDAVIPEAYTILANTSDGPRPIPAHYLPAPINDSIYMPQNTQWYAYPQMWHLGQHDLFWIHLMR